MNISRLAFAAMLSMAAPALVAQNNIAEEVAWMVGDQPIYKSEIEEAYQQALYEHTLLNGDPYCIIPENLAIDKLYLHQADIDTVEVTPSQVAAAVEQRLNYLITNLGT
ncbi:MAG: peptidylprolyl isomerase, partial [Muribaculaceae bacterium]|nr:peptidylprolyl isomerase [Muribaculaceae bacterium]